MKIAKDKMLEKLHRLEKNAAPIAFSISTKWPSILGATGQGSVQEVSDEEMKIAGREGSFFVRFGEDDEYALSGHYEDRSGRLKKAEAATTVVQMRITSSNRVRCMTIRNEHGEAYLVFRTGAC